MFVGLAGMSRGLIGEASQWHWRAAIKNEMVKKNQSYMRQSSPRGVRVEQQKGGSSSSSFTILLIDITSSYHHQIRGDRSENLCQFPRGYLSPCPMEKIARSSLPHGSLSGYIERASSTTQRGGSTCTSMCSDPPLSVGPCIPVHVILIMTLQYNWVTLLWMAVRAINSISFLPISFYPVPCFGRTEESASRCCCTPGITTPSVFGQASTPSSSEHHVLSKTQS